MHATSGSLTLLQAKAASSDTVPYHPYASAYLPAVPAEAAAFMFPLAPPARSPGLAAARQGELRHGRLAPCRGAADGPRSRDGGLVGRSAPWDKRVTLSTGGAIAQREHRRPRLRAQLETLWEPRDHTLIPDGQSPGCSKGVSPYLQRNIYWYDPARP